MRSPKASEAATGRGDDLRELDRCGKPISSVATQTDAINQATVTRRRQAIAAAIAEAGLTNLYSFWFEAVRYERGRRRANSAALVSDEHDVLRQPGAKLTCDGCGKLYSSDRTDSKFCGGACKQRAYRLRCSHAGAAA
jgi:hypothetical protein